MTTNIDILSIIFCAQTNEDWGYWDSRLPPVPYLVRIPPFCNPSRTEGRRIWHCFCSLRVGGSCPHPGSGMCIGSQVGSCARISHPFLLPPYEGGGVGGGTGPRHFPRRVWSMTLTLRGRVKVVLCSGGGSGDPKFVKLEPKRQQLTNYDLKKRIRTEHEPIETLKLS